jgi:hypothetical protein
VLGPNLFSFSKWQFKAIYRIPFDKHLDLRPQNFIMSTSPPYPSEKKAEDGSYSYADGFPSDTEEGTSFHALLAEDSGHEIRLRTMSWQKAAWLLAGDQVCLAIMAQTWSLSVLGWAPGIITMILAGVFFWITSITMHKYIMKHPQIKDICKFLWRNIVCHKY